MIMGFKILKKKIMIIDLKKNLKKKKEGKKYKRIKY